MKPISNISQLNIKAVFTDLDDTLTSNGQLPSEIVESFSRLKQRGFWLVIVSGRPAGWADCLMRLFPLDAMIFENGAGLMVRDGAKISTHNLAPTQSLSEQQRRLNSLFEDLKTIVPQLRHSTDQAYRLFDMAIDICEEPPPLTVQQVNDILESLSKENDITAKLSSIHINYWCGKHTKVTATRHLIETEGQKRGIANQNIVFTGDSPNDEPLFEYFENSVAVKNIEKYLPKMAHLPKYITPSEASAGFCELVEVLLG